MIYINKIKIKKLEIVLKSNCKFVFSRNKEQKNNLLRTIKEFISKKDSSEYAVEKNEKNIIYFNDEPLNLKKFNCILLDRFFLNFEAEEKISSKSLAYTYLYNMYINNTKEYTEKFSSIRKLPIYQNDFFEVTTVEESFDAFVDGLNIRFKKDNFGVNLADLNDEEIMLRIFDLINFDNEKSTICFLDLDIITFSFYNKIKEISQKYTNIIFICFSYFSEFSIEKEEFLFIDSHCNFFDFSSDEPFYDYLERTLKNVSLEQIRKELYLSFTNFIRI